MKYRFLRYPGMRAKAATMSFDDANVCDVRLVEIMTRHGIKGTFNLPGTSFAEERQGGRISASDAEALYYPNGHDVAIHGAQHMSLGLVNIKDAANEVIDSRVFLEGFFGKIIRGMAYADTGVTNDTVKALLRMLGITYARVTDMTGTFELPTDWLEWKMTASTRSKNLDELLDRFLAADVSKQYVARRAPLLFSLWGHSFELPDRWEAFDKFCEKLGGREDVWYCTNTELYEYCHAYDCLVFSHDNRIVYNPTQTDVFFEGSCKEYVVKAGETLIIND